MAGPYMQVFTPQQRGDQWYAGVSINTPWGPIDVFGRAPEKMRGYLADKLAGIVTFQKAEVSGLGEALQALGEIVFSPAKGARAEDVTEAQEKGWARDNLAMMLRQMAAGDPQNWLLKAVNGLYVIRAAIAEYLRHRCSLLLGLDCLSLAQDVVDELNAKAQAERVVDRYRSGLHLDPSAYKSAQMLRAGYVLRDALAGQREATQRVQDIFAQAGQGSPAHLEAAAYLTSADQTDQAARLTKQIRATREAIPAPAPLPNTFWEALFAGARSQQPTAPATTVMAEPMYDVVWLPALGEFVLVGIDPETAYDGGVMGLTAPPGLLDAIRRLRSWKRWTRLPLTAEQMAARERLFALREAIGKGDVRSLTTETEPAATALQSLLRNRKILRRASTT